MTPEIFKNAYLAALADVNCLTETIDFLSKIKDADEAKLTDLATQQAAELTELRDGMTIVVNGANYYIEGTILADVDAETREIIISCWGLNVGTGESSLLKLSPHSGANWSVVPEPECGFRGVDEFLAGDWKGVK